MKLSAKPLFNRVTALLALTLCLFLAGWQPRAHAATATAPKAPAAAAIAPKAAVNSFPMTHSLGPVLVSRTYPFYEGLEVKLSANGRLDATQHLIDNSWFAGFNGAAGVNMYDSAGNTVWSSTSHTHGVDGKYVPFRSSDRYYYWTEQVPQHVLDTPGLRIEILLWENPQLTFWDTVIDLAKQVADVVKG